MGKTHYFLFDITFRKKLFKLEVYRFEHKTVYAIKIYKNGLMFFKCD